jgi:Zn-dependent peptidase ImmA (M78 family)
MIKLLAQLIQNKYLKNMSLLGKRKGRPTTKIQFDAILKRFTIFLKRELRLTYDIPVILVDDADFAKKITAFGEITKDNTIHLSVINRHPMDILRTLAHEYIHYKQHIDKGLSNKSSRAGSPIENQANAKAGEIMRKYGQLHPELFDLMPIR